MHKTTFILLLMFMISNTYGQRKSELLAQIEGLKVQLDSTEQQLASANRKISASEAQAETFKKENEGLRDANATLLKNLSSFSELSKKNTENVNNALAALEKKEKQLSSMTDAISQNDSISIVQAPLIQQKLGNEAKVGLAGSAIVITYKLDDLLGSDTSTTVSESGNILLSKVAEVIRANPSRGVLIQGLNITGEFDLSWKQAGAVATQLSSTHGLTPNTIDVTTMDGNFSEGINIVLQPDYKKFYISAKSQIRN